MKENQEIDNDKVLSKEEQLIEAKRSQELQEKIKKNLLWVAIFSIIMLFAGITSGYIVAKGSDFWVKLKLPNEFTISTILIILSSALIYGASYFVKNKKEKLATPLISIALILGLAFGYLQYTGYLKLSNGGSALTSNVINLEGKYGEYFTLYYQNKEISFDGENYFWQGEVLTEDLKNKMIGFCKEVMPIANEKDQPINNYGIFMLKYKNEPVLHNNNRFEMNNKSLSPEQKNRLYRFSESIVSGRGDFFMIGKYGDDFIINYKDKPVEYKNRKFYQNGQEMSAFQINKLNGTPNRNSSFIFAFVFVHILHWLAGIITLIVLTVNSLKGKYLSTNFTGLKIGSIYWHFLGILWLYLYAFLNLIH